MRNLLAIGLALAALTALVLPITPSVRAAAPQTVTVVEKEYSLILNTYTVNVNEPVRFQVTNSGTIEHSLKVEFPARNIEQVLFKTNLVPGETRTAEFTFSVVGDWDIYCPIPGHKDAGMKGIVHVTAAENSMQTSNLPATAPSLLPASGGAAWDGLLSLAAVVGALVILLGFILLSRMREI